MPYYVRRAGGLRILLVQYLALETGRGNQTRSETGVRSFRAAMLGRGAVGFQRLRVNIGHDQSTISGLSRILNLGNFPFWRDAGKATGQCTGHSDLLLPGRGAK